MVIQGLIIEEKSTSTEGNDRSFKVGRYSDGVDQSAGIYITTKFQFNDTHGNMTDSKVIWLHKSCLPKLRDAIDRFFEAERIESDWA